ncbi:hypothetical protein PILCRDRAFT_812924 [Piloderma croceum F 1598]|uniref:Sas10 C-terminal domain-containing protein n=1 Tax=Piloderma croceum (strain F 1598) TaxID=765440 RepID=A0A0C3GBE1_PILCF|nr:hypothetical protein PILCRDRAFT_812924 [Piloderma croceum F 1598]
MPRRPSKSKGANKSSARPVNRAAGKIKRWDKLSDIPMDEEDQFHTSRDKILLEGDESGGEDDGDEDEVFGLQGLPEEDSDDEDNLDQGEDQEDVDMEQSTSKSKSKKSKGKKSTVKESSESSEPESDEETWGRNKSAYYSSNAAQLESDDEEANELEEQEAKRLQAKARDAMDEDDFGLGDPHDIVGRQIDVDDFAEPTAQVVEPLPQDKQTLIRYLEKTSPETLALARDWDDTAWNLMRSQTKIKKLEAESPDALSLGMVHLHYQTLLTYATTLAFYLRMRSSEQYAQRPELLKSHPILARLLTLKQSLSTLEELDFAASDEESDIDDDDESLSLNMDGDEDELEQLWKFDRSNGLEADELDDLLMDAQSLLTTSKLAGVSSADKPPKKKRKTDSDSKKPALPAFDLVEPEYNRSKTSSSNGATDTGELDAYGEATSLQHADQADKNARKKSLRFHTSKIESASARRQGARNNAVGGDDDIPYKERRKEKDARIAKEAEKKTKSRGQGGDNLDDVEPENEGRKRERDEVEDSDEDDGEDSADGYYELVKRKTKEKKAKKKGDYEEAQAAARPDFQNDTITGPRSLTRAILSNKGLTPHRSKSVRNPRVKKRQKFEKAKKKVSSQKAVYKGGIGDTGRYDGEKSGISKVVKSVRLG